MPDIDYLKLANEKEKEFSDLHSRNDSDKKLLTLDDFIMQDKDGRQEPDVDNITMNDAAVFANRVHNTLIKADSQAEVEGEGLKDKDTSLIEDFIRDINLEADSFIQNQDIPSFKAWEIMQSCDRGRIARRITLREEDGKLAPESFLPIDTRYLLYESSIRGLKWAANRLPRSKYDIEEEYGEVGSLVSSVAIVTDVWDATAEYVYIGKEKVAENENTWGEVPFVIQVVPSGIFTMDDDKILQSGESIFATNRDLYVAKNEYASILKTLTKLTFQNGLQLEVENIGTASKPEAPPYGKKIIVPVQKGTKGYFSMPVQDLSNACQMFYNILDAALQDGSLPKVSYGTQQFPLSGAAISSLKEAEDPVYLPRLQALSLFWQRMYRMIIKQYINLKLNLELGEPGFRKKYSYKDLDKSYSIKFTFDLVSPQQNMVNISTAAAVGGLVSDDTKRRDYLHVKNPTLEEQKILTQRAEMLSPSLRIYNTIKALFDQGMKTEATLMAAELGKTLEQVLSGEVPGQANQLQEEQPKQLMPLYGGSGGSLGNPPASSEPVQGV